MKESPHFAGAPRRIPAQCNSAAAAAAAFGAAARGAGLRSSATRAAQLPSVTAVRMAAAARMWRGRMTIAPFRVAAEEELSAASRSPVTPPQRRGFPRTATWSQSGHDRRAAARRAPWPLNPASRRHGRRRRPAGFQRQPNSHARHRSRPCSCCHPGGGCWSRARELPEPVWPAAAPAQTLPKEPPVPVLPNPLIPTPPTLPA
jgi:hypothetical protein